MPAAPAIVLLEFGGEGARAEAAQVDAVARAVRRVHVVEGEAAGAGSRPGDVDRRVRRWPTRLPCPPAGTETVPAEFSLNAAGAPEVVVRSRSFPLPSPNVVVPVVFVRSMPPLPESVTVIVVERARPHVGADRVQCGTACLGDRGRVARVAGAEADGPAFMSETADAALGTPVLSYVKSVTLNVPAVPFSSRPGSSPAVPASTTFTSSIVPPPVSPAAPAMPPPVPFGSMLKPRTSLPSSRLDRRPRSWPSASGGRPRWPGGACRR